VVASESDELYYKVFANDGLSQIAALRGDRAGFTTHAARLDALNWESGSSSAAAQVLYYRGLSYRELGDTAEARSWLGRALTFAEKNGYNQIVFQAEEALASLSRRATSTVPAGAPSAAPLEVREGLRAMRQELALSV
jgi:hypothetical protein